MSENDKEVQRRRRGRSLNLISSTKPLDRSRSLLRALSPSRSLIEQYNPLKLTHSYMSPAALAAPKRLLSRPSASTTGSSTDQEVPDCAEPVSMMAKSFVTILTAASMYAGMELDSHIDGPDGSKFHNIEEELHSDSESLPLEPASIDSQSATTADDSDESVGSSTDSDQDMFYDQDEISEPEGTETISLQTPPTGLKSEDSSTSSFPSLRRRSTLFELSVIERLSSRTSGAKKTNTLRALAISKKLKDTFALDDNENFLGDYPCWLLRDVLLQGHLYLTTRHLLFFAFLPRRQGKISMSGTIGVVSSTSRRVSRRWAVLRDRTLSLYSSPTDMYFPSLTIDLQYALRADLVHSKSLKGHFLRAKLPTSSAKFKLLTEYGSYTFQVDSVHTASYWVSSLKKHIFAARNKGNHVIIKMPLPNILDMELTPVVEFSHTLRLRVMESPDSFAVDDYYLIFSQGGDEAVSQINGAKAEADMEEEHLHATSTATFKPDQSNLTTSTLTVETREPISPSASSLDSPKSSSFRHLLHSPRLHASSISRIARTLSPRSSDKQGVDADSNSELSGDSSVVEKVVRYEDDDEVPEIELGNDGNVSQMNNSASQSSEGSDYVSVEDQVAETPNEENMQLIRRVNNMYLYDQLKWGPMSLVKGIYNTTTSGIGHVANLTTMWAASPSHYDDDNSLERGEEDPFFVKDPQERLEATARFQKHFSLPPDTKLISSYYAHLIKNIPVYGKIYLSDNYICYKSLIPGTNTLMILPFKDIENVDKEKGFRFGYSGLVIVIHGHEELFFEFASSEARDDCETLLLKQQEKRRLEVLNSEKTVVDEEHAKEIKLAASETDLSDARLKFFESKLSSLYGVDVPIILDENPFLQTEFKPKKSYRVTLLTIGSRGDVQPYIALGKGLLKEGNSVKIVTHEEFRPWVESHGLSFAPIAGDPAQLMSLMVTHGTLSVSFLKEASSKFRGWINELLSTSWGACQDTDILIESPSAMAGIHIAEALGVPYFRAFTMPWTKTRAYPHAFIVPDQKRGGSYNYLTHVMFENVFWKGISGQVNKWRVETLKLPKTNLELLQQSKVPFLYNISPTVFPPSVDFASWIKVTGYWFLDEGNTYEPPQELLDFMQKARDDGKKIVYIGFGSIVVSNPKELTQAVVDAVLDADVRCILNKGWSDRLGSLESKQLEVPLPPTIYNSGSIPHDWLFPQIDAAVHHGGSGTTGATLRAGLPTIIKPFFGDQFFYANRVVDIGAGVFLRKLNAKSLSKLIREATSEQRIIQKAKDIGEKIRQEDGTSVAIETIYAEVVYAKNLILAKRKNHDQDLETKEEISDPEPQPGEETWLVV